MNSKGLAISGIIYTILVIVLIMMSMILFNLQNRKTILDTLKTDSIDAVEKINNIDYLLERIQTLEKNALTLDKLYTIGAIYISMDSKNPAEFLGGKWEAIGEGRTLVGNNGTSYKTGATGGASSVTLLTKNLPEHTHSIPSLSGSTSSNGSHYHSIPALSVSAWSGSHSHVGPTSAWYNMSNGGYFTNRSYDGVYHNSQSDYASTTPSTGYTTITVSGQKTTATNTGSSTHSHTISTTASTTGATGGGEAVSVQNPYIVVYMWKRIG